MPSYFKSGTLQLIVLIFYSVCGPCFIVEVIYEICYLGMEPSLVLTSAQKKIRFRHVFKKRLAKKAKTPKAKEKTVDGYNNTMDKHTQEQLLRVLPILTSTVTTMTNRMINTSSNSLLSTIQPFTPGTHSEGTVELLLATIDLIALNRGNHIMFFLVVNDKI